MKKLILLLIIDIAFASGIKAQSGFELPPISNKGEILTPRDAIRILDSMNASIPLTAIQAGRIDASRILVSSDGWVTVYPAPEPDTINYIVVFKDTTKDVNGQVIYPVILTQKISGFKTQVTLGTFLNEKVDSLNLISVFDVRTKKPLKASFSVEEKVVERVVAERQRNRKWRVQ